MISRQPFLGYGPSRAKTSHSRAYRFRRHPAPTRNTTAGISCGVKMVTVKCSHVSVERPSNTSVSCSIRTSLAARMSGAHGRVWSFISCHQPFPRASRRPGASCSSATNLTAFPSSRPFASAGVRTYLGDSQDHCIHGAQNRNRQHNPSLSPDAVVLPRRVGLVFAGSSRRTLPKLTSIEQPVFSMERSMKFPFKNGQRRDGASLILFIMVVHLLEQVVL